MSLYKNSNDQEPNTKRQCFAKSKTISDDLWPLILEFIPYETKWVFRDFALVCKLFNTTSHDSIKLFSTMQNTKTRYNIRCSKNSMKFVLPKLRNLQVLDLCAHSFETSQTKQFVAYLKNFKQLQVLNLSFVNLGNTEIAKSIVIGLKELEQLRELKLNHMTPKFEITDLIAVLKRLKQLRVLELSSSVIPDNVVSLAPILQDLEFLQELDLSWNKMESSNLTILVPCLRQLKTLRKLSLGGNNFGSQDAKMFEFILQELDQLQVLELFCCNLGCDGLVILVPCLKQLKHLKRLDLGGNGFRSKLPSEFVVMVKESKQLNHLSLRYNAFIMHNMELLDAWKDKQATQNEQCELYL